MTGWKVLGHKHICKILADQQGKRCTDVAATAAPVTAAGSGIRFVFSLPLRAACGD